MVTSMHKETMRDERLVHRIEAFSDLVMGFSLALLAVTLVVPEHARDLFAHPFWLATYFWTFGVIASIWFNHQRLFSLYFQPTRLSIFLNFVLLSMLGLIVFFVQAFGRLHVDEERAVTFVAYFVTLGVAVLILGVLYVVGIYWRHAHLSEKERHDGIRYGLRGLIVGAMLLVGSFFAAHVGGSPSMNASYPLLIAAAIAAVANRLIFSRFKERIDAFFCRNTPADHHA